MTVASLTIRPTTQALAELEQPARYYQALDLNNQLRADKSRRRAVRFPSRDLSLAGHLYRPPSIPDDAPTPGVVMCGPFSSVKDQTLPHYAERISDAGYSVLTFDPASYGESEGEPRAHHDPNRVIDDYSNAVGYMLTREDIDSERVAVVGVCMGGGYAISVAARDRRVKAAVSVAGGFNIGGTFQQLLGVEQFAAYFRKVNDLVQRERVAGETAYIPTTAPGLTEDTPVAAMPVEEAHSYYQRTSLDDAPNWSPVMTAASLQPYFIYNSIVHAPLVAPTPLMIIHGTIDSALLPEYAQEAYDAAVGTKEMVWIETHNHIELYDQDPYVSEAAAHILRWLGRHVGAA